MGRDGTPTRRRVSTRGTSPTIISRVFEPSSPSFESLERRDASPPSPRRRAPLSRSASLRLRSPPPARRSGVNESNVSSRLRLGAAVDASPPFRCSVGRCSVGRSSPPPRRIVVSRAGDRKMVVRLESACGTSGADGRDDSLATPDRSSRVPHPTQNCAPGRFGRLHEGQCTKCSDSSACDSARARLVPVGQETFHRRAAGVRERFEPHLHDDDGSLPAR